MPNFKFANNVQTTLAAPITTVGQTTITLSSAANLPTLTGGQVMALTLNDASSQAVFEIVYVTAIVGAVLTVVRGQEGTAANTWLANDNAYASDTAAILNGFALINGSTANNFSVAALTMAGALTGATSGSFSGNVNVNGINVTNGVTSVLTSSFSGGQTLGLFFAATALGTASFSTPGVVTTGDLAAQRTTSKGLIGLGGAADSGSLDFGVNTGSTFTLSRAGGSQANLTLAANGSLNAGAINGTGTLSSGTLNGNATAGDFSFSRSASTGVAYVGSSTTTAGLIDFGLTNAGGFTWRNAAGAFAPMFGGAYTNSSDKTLKNKIKPLAFGTDEILALKPVSFTRKKGEIQPVILPALPLMPILPDEPTDEQLEHHALLEQKWAVLRQEQDALRQEHEDAIEAYMAAPEEPGLGFLAQDVELVLPVLVTTANDGLKGVNYDGIIPVLVKHCQDEVALRKQMQAALKAAGIKGF